MPDRLSLRSTLFLVALAFGLAVVLSALLGGGSSTAQPAVKQSAPRVVAVAPGAEPDLSLAAAGTVPALRNPRPLARKKKRSVRKVKPPPTVAPTPAASVSPTPTATPIYIPPAPKRSTPAQKPAKPKPKPTPTATPPESGEFDSSGES